MCELHDASMLLSSRQAAILLDTHESSIKRWCNAEEIACSTTSGGHRRIALSDLLEFAKRSGTTADVLIFEDDAEAAVKGVLTLRRSRVTLDLQITVGQWLLDAQSYKVSALLRLARKFGVALPVMYDRLIGSVMKEVGESWARGAFQVGEEHRISEAVLDVLYGQQALAEQQLRREAPTVVLGTMRNEQHITGAMMVRTLLTEGGWKVAYLGRNVPEEDFLLFQQKTNAPLICLSATTTRPPEKIIDAVNRLFILGSESAGFMVAVGGSGAPAAQLLAKHLTQPDRVRFFDSSTDFSKWASSFLAVDVLVADEIH